MKKCQSSKEFLQYLANTLGAKALEAIAQGQPIPVFEDSWLGLIRQHYLGGMEAFLKTLAKAEGLDLPRYLTGKILGKQIPVQRLSLEYSRIGVQEAIQWLLKEKA